MDWKELPEEFLEQQRSLLGEEYPDYLEELSRPWSRGLRVNTGKLSPEHFRRLCPGRLRQVPWIPNGFYLEEGPALPSLSGFSVEEGLALPPSGAFCQEEGPGIGQRSCSPVSWNPAKDPYYYAGLYYLQEPSAMTPAAFLPVKPGDRVLDLCAAPGGKATELGARLQGRGMLFANDISNSRAKGLLKNLELFGISNACVTSEAPEVLAQSLPEFFDSILVDAPCSGEGMFRKEPGMVKDWLERGPAYYSPLQREILAQAVAMLKPGGYLLYSTCTFSVLEDEENVSYVLERFPQMALEPLPSFPGAAEGMGMAGPLRLFPHRLRGEGHFLALFRKAGGDRAGMEEDRSGRDGAGGAKGDRYVACEHRSGRDGAAEARRDRHVAGENSPDRGAAGEGRAGWDRTKESSLGRDMTTGFFSFMEEVSFPLDPARLMAKGENLFYLPEDFPNGCKLRYLRTGLWLGTVKKGRFEPSQAFAMALRPGDYPRVFRLSHEDERVIRYLKGETLTLRQGEALEKGWHLVCVEDFPLGWAKEDKGRLKNKYYPGWRYQ